MIATIAAIVGKNVQQSLRSYGSHFLVIVVNAMIPTIAEVWLPYDLNDCWTFFPAIAAIVAIIWKPTFSIVYSYAIELVICGRSQDVFEIITMK